jgi:recombination protein RecA
MVKKTEDSSMEKIMSGSDLTKKLTSAFGSKNVVQLVDDTDVRGIPTGIIALDKSTGVPGGGLPIGKITEIYGDFATGKSYIAYRALVETQRIGGIAVLLDTEYAYNPVRGAEMGMDNTNLVILTPSTQEEAYDQIDQMIDIVRSSSKKQLLTIVWDSISSLPSAYEVENEYGKSNMGTNARVNSSALKEIIGKIAKNEVCLIFLNQIRKKLGVMFGQDWDTTGGSAIKFYSRLRIHAKISKQLKEGDEKNPTIIGVGGHVEITKNLWAPPFRKVYLELLFDSGISKFSGMFEYLQKSGKLLPAVSKEGNERKGYYTLDGYEETFTEKTFDAFLDSHPEITDKV